LTARLPRLSEREDWRARFEECQHKAPLLLERGVGAISVPLIMPEAQTAPQSTAGLTFDQVAQHMMDQVQAMDRRVGGQPTRFTNLQAMRRRQRALKVKQEVEFHVSGQEQDRG
jgi:hypothetical protein